MNYAAIQKKVQKAIAKTGFSLQLLVVTQGAFNATLDTIATTIATYDIKGLYAEYKNYEISASIVGSENSFIKSTDRKLLIDAVGLPDLNAADSIRFLVDSIDLDVGEIKPIKPGNINLLYKVQIKG